MNTQAKYMIAIRLVSLMLLVGIPISITAQIPTLTTDDVISTQPLDKVKPESSIAKLPAKVETSEKNTQPSEKKKSNPAEDAWNAKYARILALTKKLNQEADQTELEMIKLRNQTQSANGKQPDEFNNLNQQISVLSEKSKRLKKEAAEAESNLAEINKEGIEQSFKLKEQSFKNDKGEPDHGAIKQATLQLQQEIQNAEAHIELMKVELNRLHSESLRKSNADKFALNRVEEVKSQVEAEIQNSIKKIAELKEKQSQIKKKLPSTVSQ